MVFPPDAWSILLSLLRPVHPWQFCRWGFPRLPDRASLLVFDFCAEVPIMRRTLNGHLLSGRYPEDFVMPHPLAHIIVVEHVWWTAWLPLVDNDFTFYYQWLVDGFPVWLNGRVHVQQETFEWANNPRFIREEDAETIAMDAPMYEDGEVDANGIRHWNI